MANEMWLACSVKYTATGSGTVKERKTFIAASTSDNIGSLSSQLEIAEDASVKIYCSENVETDIDKMRELSVRTPVTVLEMFGTKYVTFVVQNTNDESEKKTDVDKRNAFLIMMDSAKRSNLLPAMKIDSRADYRLHNTVVEIIKDMKIGFTQTNVDTIGQKIVDTMTECFWYLDLHNAWDKFKERFYEMPEIFKPLQGFYDFKAAHKAAKKVTLFIIYF